MAFIVMTINDMQVRTLHLPPRHAQPLALAQPVARSLARLFAVAPPPPALETIHTSLNLYFNPTPLARPLFQEKSGPDMKFLLLVSEL